MDAQLGIEDGYAAPEARFEQRSVELAFIAALQHLLASQRAVLIPAMLGFAREAADLLGRTVASVNGALRRAQGGDGAAPGPDAADHLRQLGDERIRDLAQRYIDAWSAATSTRSSRCWPRTPRSRCHRSPPGTGAGTRSPLPRRRRAPGSVARPASARHCKAGIRLLRLGRGAGELHGAVARRAYPGWACRRRRSPSITSCTAAVRPATVSATDVSSAGSPAGVD